MLAAAKPVTGCDVDDFAAVLLHHLRNHRARRVELAAQIGVEAAPPFRVGDLFDGLAERIIAAARVVDEDVYSAELAHRRGRHRIDLDGVGYVGLHDRAFAAGFAHFRGRLLELRERARCRHDIGARLRELYRHRPAQSAPGPGDYRYAVVEFESVKNHWCHLDRTTPSAVASQDSY